MVTDLECNWCCFVFDVSRKKAKLWVANYFDERYLSLRCKTLRKGINCPYPLIVDCETAEGYDLVLNCGYRFANENDECEGEKNV